MAELRNRLSSYLDRARRGEEIVVRSRNQAIARIVPLSECADLSEHLRALAAKGLVRLPREKLDWKEFFALPRPKIPLKKLRAALDAEREDD